MAASRTLVVLLMSAGAAMAVLGGSPAAAGSTDLDAGRSLFADKQCVRCHRGRGEQAMGPPLEALRRPQGEMELAGRLWNHVPAMFDALAQEGFAWPRLTVTEMAGLMSYLQAEAARDAAPDPSQGRLILVRKGCLKCHSLRREGGRVKPDLAEHRADYESAAAWAAAMWAHTPRMATMARQVGVLYPRFSGDEMGDLLAFLRSAAGERPAGGARPRPAP